MFFNWVSTSLAPTTSSSPEETSISNPEIMLPNEQDNQQSLAASHSSSKAKTSLRPNATTTSNTSIISDGSKSSVSVDSSVENTPIHKGGFTNVMRNIKSKFGKDALSDPEFKRYWMPDSSSRECYECGDKFTAVRRRKHHCRICGQIFCSKCCNEEIPANLMGHNNKSALRACKFCFKNSMTTIAHKSSLNTTQDVSDNASEKYGAGRNFVSSSLSSNFVPDLSSFKEMLLSAVSGTSNKSGEDRAENLKFSDPKNIERKFDESLFQSGFSENITPQIYSSSYKRKGSFGFREEDYAKTIHVCRRFEDRIEAGIESPLRLLQRRASSASFEDKSKKRRESFESRASQEESSREPLWIKEIKPAEDLINDKRIASDSSMEILELPNDENAIIPEIIVNEVKRRNTITSSGSTYEIELNIEQDKVSISKPFRNQEREIPLIIKSPARFQTDFSSEEVFANEELVMSTSTSVVTNWSQLKDGSLEKQVLETLNLSYETLSQNLLTQLISDYNLPSSWLSVITTLSNKSLDFVSPNYLNEIEEMDVRQLIKIKRIVNGNKNDSHIINGFVFTKNVMSRKMKMNITNPRILLLSSPICYQQRVNQKFSSLETILLQENNYLKNLVAKIASYKPNIVILDKTVARTAQELLLNLGITLVSNVKSSTLDKLSRFTGASVVNSLDAQIGMPILGTCQRLYLQTFNSNKTLMYFDGCKPQSGCTIILRGCSSLIELKKIKEITSFMIFCNYNWRLERSFLMDTFVFPPNNYLNQENIQSANDDDISNFESELEDKRPDSCLVEDESDPLRMAAKEDSNRSCVNLMSPTSSKSNSLDKEQKEKKHNEIIRLLIQDYVLICSPFIPIDMPYLLCKIGKKCPTRRYFDCMNLYWSKRFSLFDPNKPKSIKQMLTVDDSTTQIKQEFSPYDILPHLKPHPFLRRVLKQPFHKSNLCQTLLADFRARGGMLPYKEQPQSVKPIDEPMKDIEVKIDAFHPYFHQRFPVLFCSYSYSASNPPFCVNPWIVPMEFYGLFDIPLGSFLERYCFSTTYSCPINGCSTSMVDHIRKFCHGNGSIHINLKELKISVDAAQSHMITWSWCQKCKTSSPFVVVSNETWSLSFAKFLELKIYGESYSRRQGGDSPNCQNHSLFHDHFHYFAYKHLVASFKYYPILVQEIALPWPHIQLKFDAPSVFSLREDLKYITIKGYDVLSFILEKLCSLKDEVSGTKYEIIVNELLGLEQGDRFQFRKHLDDVQIKLSTQSGVFQRIFLNDSFILLKKLVAEFVQSWNAKIQDFINSKKKDEKLSGKFVQINTNSRQISVDINVPEFDQLSITGSTTVISKVSSNIDQASIGRTSSVSSQSSIQVKDLEEFKSLPDPDIGDIISDLKNEKNEKDILKMCLEEQQRECHEALEVLNQIQIDFQSDPELKLANNSQSSSSLSSIGCGISPGIQARLGKDAIASEDNETYAIYHTQNLQCNVEEQDISKLTAKTEDTLSFNSSIAASCDQTRSSTTSNIKKDTTRPSVRTLLNNILSTSSELTVESPFLNTEHYLLPMNERLPVLIKDNDPGSIIAYSLSTSEYEKQVNELYKSTASPAIRRKNVSNEGNPVQSDIRDNATDMNAPSSKSLHIDLQFSDSTTKFYCCIYFADQFRRLRLDLLDISPSLPSPPLYTSSPQPLNNMALYSSEEMYIRSLSHCIPWTARGGKSGSTFCKTSNDRFILKEMSRSELQSFLSIAKFYFDYITNAIIESRPTLLAKIIGVYKIGYKNSSTNSASKMYLLVMENLFYQRNITQKFDLKGSVRNRLASTNTPDDVVLLDENLIKMIRDTPLYIRIHSKQILSSAIDNDSYFLSSHSVMDYSLLVGIDDENKELVVGIIDYIRPFTWDKRIEMVVKSVGSHGKMPTIVSPDVYRERFCEKMDQYFLCVPDRWYKLESSENNFEEKENKFVNI